MATDFEPRSSSTAEKRTSNTQSRKQSTTTSERRNEKRHEVAREFINIRAKTQSPFKNTESQVNGKRMKDDEQTSVGKKEETQRESNIVQYRILAN